MVDKIIFDTDLDQSQGIGIDTNNRVQVKIDNKTIEFTQSGKLQIVQLTSPIFNYDVSGRLYKVTYSDGSTKDFSYSIDTGKLTSVITKYASGRVNTKTLVYASSTLASITETYA